MLADLDELVLQCRDERARAYIRESVACCKAGAYRSAIVSAWIAVSFDIIDKVHELSIAGDKNAEKITQEFEDIISKNDLTRALAFERRLLDIAKDEFELISAQEHVDLERLQQDRHRCAHPSHSKFGQVFSPPAELARVHIRAAVEHLLHHEPAQGKAALDRLVQEIFSEYFPAKQVDALAYLSSGALKRARPSLVRNLMLVLLKAMLDTASDHRRTWNSRRALQCIRDMYPAIWGDVIRADLTRLFRKFAETSELIRGIELLNVDASLAEALEADQVARLQQFTSDLPADRLEVLDTALDIPQLANAARSRVLGLSAKDVRGIGLFMLPTEVRQHSIKRFAASSSFDKANDWGRTVQQYADEFTDSEVKTLLGAASTNPEIQGSFQLRGVINALKKHSKIPDEEFKALAHAAIGKKETGEAETPSEFDEDIPF